MAAKLKVYITRIGFHDVAVAAPNQKAALAAWDIRENLFAQGAASVADDPAAIKSAMAEPGRPVSRAIGESGAFKAAAEAPSQAPKVKAPKARMKAAAPKPRPPDRRRLDAAEKALAAFDKERKTALGEIDKARRDLDLREAALERKFATRRRSLAREQDAARRVYEAALGR